MERPLRSVLLPLMYLASLCLAQDEFPVLKVGSVLTKPFLHETSPGEYEGFVKDLMNALADKLSFTYEIVFANDDKYGHKSPETGKWTGMVGMAIDGEADLIVADLTQTKERDTVLDFSTPFMTSSLTILTKKFSTFGSDAFFLTQPFSFKLWSLILVLFVATGIGLYLTARITPYEHWSENLTYFLQTTDSV